MKTKLYPWQRSVLDSFKEDRRLILPYFRSRLTKEGINDILGPVEVEGGFGGQNAVAGYMLKGNDD